MAEKGEKKPKAAKTLQTLEALKPKFYKIEGGNITRTRPSCPKCGAGTFLALHKDRTSCGHCGYTEFKKAG